MTGDTALAVAFLVARRSRMLVRSGLRHRCVRCVLARAGDQAVHEEERARHQG